MKSATQNALSNVPSGTPNRLLNSLHRYARIDGLSYLAVTSPTTYTWTATTRGGDGSWTYRWEASVNGGAWSVVSSNRPYSHTIYPGEHYDLQLRLTATSFGEATTAVRLISVRPASGTCLVEPCP